MVAATAADYRVWATTANETGPDPGSDFVSCFLTWRREFPPFPNTHCCDLFFFPERRFLLAGRDKTFRTIYPSSA